MKLALCGRCERCWCGGCSKGDPWRFFVEGEEGEGKVCPWCARDTDAENEELEELKEPSFLADEEGVLETFGTGTSLSMMQLLLSSPETEPSSYEVL